MTTANLQNSLILRNQYQQPLAPYYPTRTSELYPQSLGFFHGTSNWFEGLALTALIFPYFLVAPNSSLKERLVGLAGVTVEVGLLYLTYRGIKWAFFSKKSEKEEPK